MENMSYKIVAPESNYPKYCYQLRDPYCLEDDYSDEEPETDDEEDFYDKSIVEHPEYWL